jgi:hypothetical protein
VIELHAETGNFAGRDGGGAPHICEEDEVNVSFGLINASQPCVDESRLHQRMKFQIHYRMRFCPS